ncbi:hypothetical protein FEM48_Zijuj04G0094400 [Ziziphus jujuba var. spinosa]|uniref:RNase III domain-containing protein n=1 Tax=Ziziphus jujuba var. spinosa TaxID=714518 RepID=A0A978VJ31_ZIZJJ|nr:hypothetical protein FEM48_Zijuj04G0094400 [Ziziphus jujuba var. spinosa]
MEEDQANKTMPAEEEVVGGLNKFLCINNTKDGRDVNLEELEEILGYKFNNKRLLEEAFTHASALKTSNSSSTSFSSSSSSYERLEFVGDAVLSLLISREHYFLYPDLSSGPLTRLRSSNVDTEKLARVAVKHGLHRFLRHNKPKLEDEIRKFIQEISEFPLHSNGLIDVPKDLADIVESAIGAVFIDSDSSLDIVWKVFKSLLEPIISPETIKRHPVTELYEICQKNNLKVQFVDLWKKNTGFDVYVQDKLIGSATYGLKKEIAHNRAAKDALNNIGRVLSEKYSIQG